MRKIKIPKARQKVIQCPKCRCITLRLFQKAWVKRSMETFIELEGYYRCTNCGDAYYRVFEIEPI